jgi:hypothetical protein
MKQNPTPTWMCSSTSSGFSIVGDGGAMAGSWIAKRGGGRAVRLTVAPKMAAEAEAIRDHIELLRRCLL